MIFEVAELAIGDVGDGVGVLSGWHIQVGIADVDALAVGLFFDAKLFGVTFVSYGPQLEADGVVVANSVAVIGGKITKNSVANLVAVGEDGDGFGDLEGGVLLES